MPVGLPVVAPLLSPHSGGDPLDTLGESAADELSPHSGGDPLDTLGESAADELSPHSGGDPSCTERLSAQL